MKLCNLYRYFCWCTIKRKIKTKEKSLESIQWFVEKVIAHHCNTYIFSANKIWNSEKNKELNEIISNNLSNPINYRIWQTLFYENHKIFLHGNEILKYADKTNEEGMQQKFWPSLSLTQNCKYFKNSYDWLLNRNEDRASSGLDDPIQDENSLRNEKLIDTKFQSSLFGRVFPLSLLATLPFHCHPPSWTTGCHWLTTDEIDGWSELIRRGGFYWRFS